MRPYQVVFHFWIRPFQRGWGQLTPNPAFCSRILLSESHGRMRLNYCRGFWSMSRCCAQHADWPPVRWAQGLLNYFSNGHINVLLSQTTRLIGIKFSVRKQGNEALSVYAILLNPPPPKGLGDT